MSWEKAIAFTLRWEGGYVNDPDDAGGATNRGITQNTLNAAHAKGLVPHNNIRALTKAEAMTIYKMRYWTPYDWGRYGAPIDMILFDIAVNHGPGNAAKLAQRACVSLGEKLAIDSKWGPATRNALYRLAGARGLQLAKMLLIKRLNFYDNIVTARPTQAKFLKGWTRRTQELATAANVRV